MSRANRFSPEVRERAVRLVQDHTKDHASQWAAIQSIAAKLRCTAETLRRWVREDERNAGVRPGLTADERARLEVLEQENRELRRANEVLSKASAFWHRRSSTADRRDGGLHRRPSRSARSRAALRGPADRSVDLLRRQDAAVSADDALCLSAAECATRRGHPAGPSDASPHERDAEGLATAASRGRGGGPLHRRAAHATARPAGG